MAYGGKVFNQIAPNALPDHENKSSTKVKKVLQPISRAAANIEAEKGETAFILDEGGLPAHYEIGGKRHTEGGTPLNVPEDTFIFSDTKGMVIKDPQILAQFGEAKSKTPADIAKKYDMNQYRKVLSDKDTDDLQRQTAEKMIENYTMLLGKLALVQESMKGFPQGVPMIAQPYMIMNNIKPEDILPKQADQQPQQPQLEEAEAMEEGPMPQMAMFGYEAPPMLPPTYFANGGSSRGRMVRITRAPQYSYGGSLPKAQIGLQTASDSLNYQLNKIADYEYTRGSDMGTGLPNYGNKRLNNPTKQQAVDWITQNVVPKVSPYFTSPTEQAEATDFLYNTGRDPRIYMLDQYLQSIGQSGLPNRGSFNLDTTKPEHASAWKTKKAELDKLWKQHEKNINTLPENDKRILLNKGRDFYYRNINVKPDGSPSDAYDNTWYGRIWNTNDYAPFDKNNPKFTPKKKAYGGYLPKAQTGDAGRGGRQDTYDYVSAWAQQYLENSTKGNYATELPPTMTDPTLRTRVKTQGAIAGYEGAFGDREIIDNFGEFKKRHNWFFKDYPNITVEEFLKNNGVGKSGIIEKFQQSYNAKAAEYGLPEYFTKDGPQGTKLDAVYGEHTYSAPGFNPAPAKQTIPTEETTTELDTVNIPDVEEGKKQVPYSWFPQDIINLGVAASTKIPRMKTFYEPLQFRTPDAAYLRENYSPMLAAESTGVQGAMAYAQKPGAFAMTSALAGKTAAEATKHNLDIANLNAEKYDRASIQAATIANTNAEYNSRLKMQDYDARQLYERDRIMAQNKKRAEIAKGINTGITNAASIYNLNQINQQYAIDPRGGGLVTYVNPKMLAPDEDALMDARFQEFNMWRSKTDLSDEQIINIMKAKNDGMYNNTNAFVNPYDYAAASTRMMSNEQ
jgi:hypothetical protein